MDGFLSMGASAKDKLHHYRNILIRIKALLADENDWVAAMATVSCELHHSFEYFHWTGFYRVVAPGLLKIGPYQGPHGCLVIPFARGVCGAAAREKRTQLVANVETFDGHIACSSTTKSEIVIPLCNDKGQVTAVFDVDSNHLSAFDKIDQENLEKICAFLERRYHNV